MHVQNIPGGNLNYTVQVTSLIVSPRRRQLLIKDTIGKQITTLKAYWTRFIILIPPIGFVVIVSICSKFSGVYLLLLHSCQVFWYLLEVYMAPLFSTWPFHGFSWLYQLISMILYSTRIEHIREYFDLSSSKNQFNIISKEETINVYEYDLKLDFSILKPNPMYSVIRFN